MKRAFEIAIPACIFIALLATPAIRAQAGPSSAKSLEITAENADALQHLQDYPNLEALSISCLENLQALPDSIGALKNLREPLIDNGNGCSMNPALPESIGNLVALRKLVLFGVQDPRPAGKDNSPQPLHRHPFPRAMSQLTGLTSLDLGRNGLEEIPDFVKDLPHLKDLEFRWNMKLKRVPTFLLQLRKLQTLASTQTD